ncbi:MAG: SufS family cysteine desulfurase [Actinomycetes bacterium]
MTLDVARLRADFPILRREIDGHRLVYLDTASSAQKPTVVLDAMDQLYRQSYANVHRGVYTIAEEATTAFEAARTKVAGFIGSPDPHQVVFTRNATEAINLVAHTWGRANLQAGDVVVLSHLEHHANIVPWHMLAAERGIELRWIPLTPDHHLDLSGLDQLLSGATLLSVTAMSNVTGTIVDVPHLVAAARAVGAHVLVDACQAVAQMPLDVTAWGADFVTFSSHKIYGPSGIGALWARRELLDAMPPFLGGGEMIRDVSTEGFTTNDVPWKFEAGTPAIAEAVGMGAAVDYLTAIGMRAVREHERALTAYALDALRDRFADRITLYGPPDPDDRGGVISFLFGDIHAHDVSQVVDEAGVCVRAGHHCAKPLMRVLGVPATSRVSFGVYNDRDDVDALVEALGRAERFFAL